MTRETKTIAAIREFASAVVQNTKANMQGKAGKPSIEQRKALNLLRLTLGREPSPQEVEQIVGVE